MTSASAPLRIATRASELALRQARTVQGLLAAAGIECELRTYRTAGDRNLDKPLREIGAKGLFTEELERDLIRGKVDCCVHSLKDLPTTMADDLVLGAILKREDPRDALVINSLTGASSLSDLPRGSRVGTSSLRRKAQLLALRRDLEVVELRGNVPTRLRKVDEGQVHAAILAAAGLHRLDIRQRIAAYLDAPEWLPAAGQGAIAVQIRAGDDRMIALLAGVHDTTTAIETRAERAFLAALEGGCQVPIGAIAFADSPAPILHGLVADTEGREVIRASQPLDPADPELSGIRVANDLRREGATEILGGLQRADRLARPQPE